MKKIGLLTVVGLAIVVAIAIMSAGKMGETVQANAQGTVVLGEGLESQAQGATTLFLTVYFLDQPMPYGTFKKTLTSEPSGELFRFSLTYDNLIRMRQDLSWPEEFRLKARLDRDGAGGPDQPGDLVGELQPVKIGSRDLVVKIDRVVE